MTGSDGRNLVKIRTAREGECSAWFDEHWHGATVVVHGTAYRATDVEWLIAENAGQVVGALSYRVCRRDLEIVSIDALTPGHGVGRALVDAVVEWAGRRGLRRVWCTTTNDNLAALGFWQAVGLRLCALRPDAVSTSRELKPGIPEIGERGIPIRDELDLELLLG